MQDAELADLVATDLAAHLAGRAGELDGPAYAVCLWIELGELVVSIATEPGFARRRAVPAYRDIPDEQLRAPAGIRWPSGGWDAAPEPFVSGETLAALAPLAAPAQAAWTAGSGWLGATRRLISVGTAALAAEGVAAPLPQTPDLIAYVEVPGMTAPDLAQRMLATAPVDRLRTLFPHWNRLADAVAAARSRPEVMADLHERVARVARREVRFPALGEPAPDELTEALRDCGLEWWDVSTSSRKLRTALAVADALA